MNIVKIFEYALAREYQGKQFFTEYAQRLQSADAVGAFRTIAAEEQKHIEFIQAQLAALQAEGQSSAVEMPAVQFFTDQAGAASIEQVVSESMVADLPVLRMAYLIEHGIEAVTGAFGKIEDVLNSYLRGGLRGAGGCHHDHPDSCGGH